MFNTTFDRPDAPNIAILVTDGMSNINSKRTVSEAENARNNNIQIYTIGIGLTDTREVLAVASTPSEKYSFNVQSFDELKGLDQKVFSTIFLGPAFSAVFKGSQSSRILDEDEVLKFDEVYLNRDGGYDPSTGFFTAPLSGIYMVASTIKPYGSTLHCYLWHNAKRVGLIFGSGRNTGSLQITVVLVKGDKLSIKHSSKAEEKIQGGDTSMFSAVYISE